MPAFFVKTEGKAVRVVLLRRKPKGPWWYKYWFKGVRVYRSSEEFSERNARAVVKKRILAPDGGATPAASAGQDLESLVLGYLDTTWPEYTGRHRESRPGHPFGMGPKLPAKHENRTYESACGRLLAFSDWATATGQNTRLLQLSALEAKQLVQRYANERRKSNTGTTVHNEVAVIGGFFNFLRKTLAPWEYNPGSKTGLFLPRKRPEPFVPVTVGELRQLITSCRESPLWPLVLLTFGCGLRPKGACSVALAAVSLGEWPSVRVTEKGVPRTVAMTAWVVEEFKAWLPEGLPQDARLWPASENHAHNTLRDHRNAQAPVIGEHVSFQALRRVHSTLCYRAGMTPKEESRRLGHSVVVADKHYIQWGDIEGEQLNLLGDPLTNLDQLLRKIGAKPAQIPAQKASTENAT